MARVGDEALLLFVALRHGTDDAVGEKGDQQQHHDIAQQGDGYAGKEKAAEGVQLSAAVQEKDAGGLALRADGVAEIAGKAPALTLLQDIVRGQTYTITVGSASGSFEAA